MENSEYYQGDESSVGTNISINEEKMDTEEIEKMIEEFSLNDLESKYSYDESDLSVEEPDELINSYYNPEYNYTSEEEDIDYVKKIEELADKDLFSETETEKEEDLLSGTDTEEYDIEKGKRERELWESFLEKYRSKKKKKYMETEDVKEEESSELSVETIPMEKQKSPMSITPLEERIEKQLKKLKLDSPIKIRIPRRKFKGTPYERKK